MVSSAPPQIFHFRGVRRAEPIIGNQHGRGFFEKRYDARAQFSPGFPVHILGWFPVNPNDLLALPVAESAQDSRFNWRRKSAHRDDVSGGNILRTEISDERRARFVVADSPHQRQL